MNLSLSTTIKYLYEKDLADVERRSGLVSTINSLNQYNLYIIRTANTSKEKYEASSRYIKNKTKQLRESYSNLLIHEIIIDNVLDFEKVLNHILKDNQCVGYIIQEPFLDTSYLSEDEMNTYSKMRNDFEDKLFHRNCDINIDIDKTTLFSRMLRYKEPDNINLYPITTRSCINLIHEFKLLRDSTIVVIGRSDIVTKPLIEYLIHKGYTVININSKTPLTQKKRLLEIADCIVLATGCYGVLNLWDYILKQNVFIIDVGINIHPETGKLVGDFALEKNYSTELLTLDRVYKQCENVVAYTPVPGGVGKLTSIGFTYAVSANLLTLLLNTIKTKKGE